MSRRKFPLDNEVMGFSIIQRRDEDTGETVPGFIGQYYTLAPERDDVVMRSITFDVSKAQLKRMTKLAQSTDFIVEKTRLGRIVLRKEHAQLVTVQLPEGDQDQWWFAKEYCSKCEGTGIYRWTGYQGEARKGPCFTCKHVRNPNCKGGERAGQDDGSPGKGYVTPQDVLRFKAYWEWRETEYSDE
jgi:hypothetical protein